MKPSSQIWRLFTGLALCALLPAMGGEDGTPRDRAKAMVEEFEKYYANPNEHVRKAAVMGLAECNHELAVEPLLKAMVDDSPVVRKEAEKGLARQTTYQAHHRLLEELRDTKNLELSLSILESFRTSRPKSAYDVALKTATHKSPAMRAVAAELLGVLEPTGTQSEQALTLLLADNEAEVRLASLESLAALKAASLGPNVLKLLETDPDWRVRATCIAKLKNARLAGTIQPLIDAMKKEDGRLKDDCHEALIHITGEANRLPSPEDWQQWWDRVKGGFQLPTLEQVAKSKSTAKTDPRYASLKKDYTPFVGIPTRSKRMLFILDVSNSMQDRLALESTDPARVKQFRERYGNYDTKIDLSREELINTIATLESHVKFNIVTFHTFVEKWRDDLQSASASNKNAAIKFLSRMTPAWVNSLSAEAKENGRTNTFDAINVAFGVGNDPKPEATRLHTVESDTVFLISDGLPTAGRITDPQELLRYFTAANRRAKMVFHVVTFSHGNEVLLKGFTDASGGKYLIISME